MAARPLPVALLAVALLPAAAAASRPALRLPAPVYRTAAAVAGGRIYVLGGHDSAGGTISDVYVVDPATGASRRAGQLALPTHGAAAANLGGRGASSSSAAPRPRSTTSCSASRPPAARR